MGKKLSKIGTNLGLIRQVPRPKLYVYQYVRNAMQGIAALASGFQLDFRRFAFYFDPGAKGL